MINIVLSTLKARGEGAESILDWRPYLVPCLHVCRGVVVMVGCGSGVCRGMVVGCVGMWCGGGVCVWWWYGGVVVGCVWWWYGGVVVVWVCIDICCIPLGSCGVYLELNSCNKKDLQLYIKLGFTVLSNDTLGRDPYTLVLVRQL